MRFKPKVVFNDIFKAVPVLQLFFLRVFHMRCFSRHLFFLISHSLGPSGRMCLMTLAFPGYLSYIVGRII